MAQKSYNQRKPVTRVSGGGSGGTGGSGGFDGEQPSNSNLVDLREGVERNLDLLRAAPWTERKEWKRKKLLVDTREAKPTAAKGW